ncbi:hypothetical protein PP175_17940 [Aneurinibacillus sp. Ricciae_BoGa-3]|nr:hypothetical protein [Aneurinibacillus sp. Ricciae_BoGa-3]WCK53269.1 hypothetical protein PP175_17940 [Aneurinibacillus sp. Ricciae_BoGa-3]
MRGGFDWLVELGVLGAALLAELQPVKVMEDRIANAAILITIFIDESSM